MSGVIRVDPEPLQNKKVGRSLRKTLRADSLGVAARCVILQTAVDTFCTRCQQSEDGDGKRLIAHRIKTCANTECPLHPVRPTIKGAETISTLVNLNIVAKNYGKPKVVGWTQEDEIDLMERKKRNHTIRRIALDTNRTINDVKDRLDLMRRAAARTKVLLDGTQQK